MLDKSIIKLYIVLKGQNKENKGGGNNDTRTERRCKKHRFNFGAA